MIFVSLLVLLGWVVQNESLTRVFPNFIAMKGNTALCFLLFGISGWFYFSSQRNLKLLSISAATVGGLLAALTLGEILAGWDLGIDELIFTDVVDPTGTAVPGQMAPLTAVCFVLLGFVSLGQTWLPIRIKQMGLLAVLAIAISGFVSYPFSLVSGSGLYSASGMALHTAFLFILLALLHFLEQTEAGWVTVLLSRSPLGDNTRSLLITVVLSPFILGWLTFAAESAGLINSGVARLYFSISVMLLLATVVLYNVQRLFDAERTHQLLASDFQSLQNQMQALIEHSPSPIFIKDISGRYQLVNSHFEHLVNRPRSQIIGKKNETLLPQNVLPSMLQSDLRVIETKEVVVTEMKLLVDGNQRTYLNTKFPLFDPRGAIHSIGGIWTDISEQKALNESLNVKNLDLERSNKELEQFAYVASHDLQEPLRMVSSYMQLLETRYKDKLDQDAKEFIGYAVDGALRMQRLIQDLLAFSRVGTRGKEPQPVDAGEALDQAKSNLRILIEETQTDIQSGTLPIVLADMDQLAQVFQNLIGNAIKFKGEKQPEVRISVKESNGFAEFALRDNGIGFDQRHADRIFVLFQRLNTRDKYEGTGIGLAICKKIVERHSGRIWAESQVGKGSTFHFTFRLQEKAETDIVSHNGYKEELAETIDDRASRLI